MYGTARPPSAQQLQELVELTRRDPGSPAFVDLGNAYIALGRPQDAIEVGARGLQVSPHITAGRLMVSEAFVQMHRWKEAQVELLKVVKADRNNMRGFTLLGEVLMRRADYERALPVLQHAQNLDPNNPHLQDLAYRAHTRQPLDPPPPLPRPIQPAGSSAHAAPFAGDSDFDDGMPTRVAGPLGSQMPGQMPAMGSGASAVTVGLSVDQAALGAPPPAAPPAFGLPPPAAPPAFGLPPPAAPAPPPAAAAPAPAQDAPIKKKKPRAQPLPPGAPMPRPRVLPAEKPRDAAQESLRQSAAAGEEYLNNLLMAGLLDLPSVNAPEAPFELSPGKRWGRSTRRAFIFLFVMLFASLGGGGYWYYYAAKQQSAKVSRHIVAARQLMESGAYDDLKAAVKETQQALEEDQNNRLAMAVYAKAVSLQVLLYGSQNNSADLADVAISRLIKEIDEDDEGWRDLMIARSAHTLAVLFYLEEPKNQLADTHQRLDDLLARTENDASDSNRHWARWLRGKALQAAGDYDGALQAFEQAEAGGEGPVVATISAADMYLDRGETSKAGELYDAALQRTPKHPLALIGKVLLLSETTADAAAIAGAINVGFDKDKDYGPNVEAYKTLVMAMSSYLLEEYAPFAEQLDKATGVTEPRYLARVAYGRLLQGDVFKAVDLRAQIKWYGDKDPETPPPLVALLDAELMLLRGSPDEVLARLEKLESVRAMRLRGRAYYDRGDADKAIEELEKALEIAADDLRILAWLGAARLLAAKSKKDIEEADRNLNKLGRAYLNLMVGTLHGDALLRIGRDEDARRKLETSLEEMSPEHPNPFAYRAHVDLAQLDFAEGKAKAAIEHLDKAAEQVADYLPAQALIGRLFLSDKDYDEAAARLGVVLDELSASATFDIELAYAEAVASKRKPSKEERDKARAAITRAKDKGAPAEELTRVAQMLDPALLQELGLAEAAAPPPPKKKKKSRKRGRRRR